MRRSLFVLATMAMSSVLYAQAEPAHFSREQVLDIFSQYNPLVLEQAQADADYQSVLDSFLSAYEDSNAQTSCFELIAVARNFDNSIRLQALTDAYQQAASVSLLTGQDGGAEKLFREDLTDVVSRIWAVTVQIRRAQLAEAKQRLKNIRTDHTLSKESRAEQISLLKQEIRVLKAELKSFQKNRGPIITSAVDAYMEQAQKEVSDGLLQAARSSLEVSSADNLQIKSNHKKPVAK